MLVRTPGNEVEQADLPTELGRSSDPTALLPSKNEHTSDPLRALTLAAQANRFSGHLRHHWRIPVAAPLLLRQSIKTRVIQLPERGRFEETWVATRK